MTITQQLERIGADILKHLADAKEPLTQHELYQLSELGLANKNAGLSDYGWPYALEKLERKHEIEFVPPNRWKLSETKDYMKAVESYSGKKVQP